MVRTRRSRGALLSEDSSDDDAEVVAETKTGETLRPIEDVVDEIDGVVDDAAAEDAGTSTSAETTGSSPAQYRMNADT